MTTNDMAIAIEAKSDQLNADDLLSGPVTVTITKAAVTAGEQPVTLELAEHPGKPYKPGRSMSRVLVAAWGPDSSKYVGKRLTLYRDPNVKFGGILVGGIRISHMSGLPKTLHVPLTVTRGRKAMFTVEPLREQAAPPAPSMTLEDIAAMTDLDALRGLWSGASPEIQEAIAVRANQLQAAAEVDAARDMNSPYENEEDNN